MTNEPSGDVRHAFAADRNGLGVCCVIGPNEEVVVEIGDVSNYRLGGQWELACRIAGVLNELEHPRQIRAEIDLDHCCSEEGRKQRARYTLLLIENNHIHSPDAMEFLDATVAEAGANFARERIDHKDQVPF